MPHSLRPFLGARDYAQSRAFYRTLGFTGNEIGPGLTYYRIADELGFYLQDAFVKEWIENSMIFYEVADPTAIREAWLELKLPERFAGVRISPMRTEKWGEEFFLHDPSGILWHVGCFFPIR
ncbi:glyoxalase [Lewinella sp. IMCC34183]|uniref:glyoxalase n=1 Tax=Lewinella sp. IMCC34183 TaxID=2248762 RepID=UPI000E252AFB|nr:glyoxalase [Lewinella sp. IMCC34183]